MGLGSAHWLIDNGGMQPEQGLKLPTFTVLGGNLCNAYIPGLSSHCYPNSHLGWLSCNCTQLSIHLWATQQFVHFVPGTCHHTMVAS